MTSRTQRRFWACYEALPLGIQRLASAKFRLWQREPFYPSLRFKELAKGVWSVRIGRDLRKPASNGPACYGPPREGLLPKRTVGVRGPKMGCWGAGRAKWWYGSGSARTRTTTA